MYYKFTDHKLVQNYILKLKSTKNRYRHPAKLHLSRLIGYSLFYIVVRFEVELDIYSDIFGTFLKDLKVVRYSRSFKRLISWNKAQ